MLYVSVCVCVSERVCPSVTLPKWFKIAKYGFYSTRGRCLQFLEDKFRHPEYMGFNPSPRPAASALKRGTLLRVQKLGNTIGISEHVFIDEEV